MSEEISQEIKKPKQFLLMVDELSMALLARLMPGIQFCEVEALKVKDNDGYTLLANPIAKEDGCSGECNVVG